MVKSKRNFLQEYQYIIFAFLVTSVTMLAVYLCNGMVPFGDKTILRMDLYHQYGPLFAELYDKVKEGGSFFYSWTSGLGSCFLGNYFNYLSSPIGAIVMFFGHKNIPEAIAAMILIKASLSSCTFTYYVKRSMKNQSIATVAFSVLYAFCGYMLAYYWNVMWLDAMVLLPIVLLGIERIIDNGKPATYITGLALSMFSNYYMSYMLCIFAVIYFFYYYANKKVSGDALSKEYAKNHKGLLSKLRNSRFFRSGVIFALSSLAAAGIMAFALLPVANVLTTSSATSGTFPTDAKSYFTIFDFFANHLANLTTTIRSSGDDVLPNVYCGIIPLILAPLYFFTKSISKKEKLTTLLLLTALYVSFNFNILNYIWHGMHYPNDLPYRQSFIYSFVLLIMAYKVFLRLGEFTTRQIAGVGAGLLIFVVMVQELTSKNAGTGTIIFSLALTVLYVVILAIFKDKRYEKASVVLLLLVCICSEVVMCDTSTLNISVTKEPYVSDYDDFRSLKKNLDTIEQDEFYRMELTNLRTRMDPSWYNYNGVSVFSSMADQNLSGLQSKMGMMSNAINSYTYNPQTPIYNMMFSLKYIVNNDTFNVLDSPYYTPSVSSQNFSAYRNNYYLPIAYCVNSETEFWASETYINEWNRDYNSDPFQLQADYFNYATGTENPFEEITVNYATYNNVSPFSNLNTNTFIFSKTTADTAASTVFYITTEKKGNVYIYFDVTGSNGENVTVSSSRGTTTQSTSQNCLLDLGEYDADETIIVTIPFESNSGTLKFYAYTLNDELLNEGYEKLKDNQIIVETFEDTYISGKFTAKKDCLLYTSIPYNKGWSVKIDGEEVDEDDIVALGNSLLCVRVLQGNHTVEFTYKVPGLIEGIAISVVTALILILILLINRRKRKTGKVGKLPLFEEMDNDFSEDIIMEVASEPAPSVEADNSNEIIKEYPLREVILPPKKEVTRQVIAPPPQIFVADINSTENENDE